MKIKRLEKERDRLYKRIEIIDNKIAQLKKPRPIGFKYKGRI